MQLLFLFNYRLAFLQSDTCYPKPVQECFFSETQPSIKSSEEYFIYADSILSPVKKIKDIPGLLKNKFSELDKYITTHKFSGKSEPGFIEMIKYYNSLF